MLFLGLFQALTAYAETDAKFEQLLSLSLEDLSNIKVNISTNSKQVLSKAPSIVTVITAEDIKATGSANLTEILQSVPGIYTKTNLFGARPTVTFRGAESSHTLLMVNGIPQRDLVWNPEIFSRGMPTSMIERIEIIRGPGSALYGSDASAGVINIITKTASGIRQAEAGVRAGSFNTGEGWVQHGGKWNDFDFSFTAEMMHTDGYNPYIAADAQTAKDKTTGTAVSYAPGYAQYGYDNKDLRFSIGSGNWQLLADYTQKSNVKTGLSGAGVLDPVTNGQSSRFNMQQIYNNEAFARDWGLNAELHVFHLDYTSGDGFQERPPGYTDATGTYPAGQINQNRSAEYGLGYEVSGHYSGVKDHTIRLGGGSDLENLYFVEQFVNFGKGPNGSTLPPGGPLVNVSDTPYAFAPEKIRQISHLFLQDTWVFSQSWELTAGARYDQYSDFGDTLNPRLALVWQSTDSLTTKLMYGQAFRAPSFLQLYSLTAATNPNPNLKPEKSNTWDLSFSYRATSDLNLGLTLYQFTQTDLIAADATNTFQNSGNKTSNGIEVEAMWQATRTLRVSGNLSSRDDITNQSYAVPLPVPKQKAYLRTDWLFMPNWNWNLQANWTGEHLPLAPGDKRMQIDAYTVVDTTLRYFHRRDWEFAASIRNMFDTDARERSSTSLPYNLPLPGRNLYAEMRYNF
jgi:iron complex outermembrane receptor protein